MMGNLQIDNYIKRFRKEAFRLELLNIYRVPEDWETYQRFLRREDYIDSDFQEWWQMISDDVANGKRWIRVHPVPKKLNSYLRYEIDIYKHSVEAGEEVYLMDKEKYKKMLTSAFQPPDYWMFDNEVVIEMLYDKRGYFIGERKIENQQQVERYVKFKKKILKHALPVGQWLM